MENIDHFKISIEEIKDFVKDNSFFRETPHYWVKASLLWLTVLRVLK
jgi:hypothetical protein